jgi:hypothetical protein
MNSATYFTVCNIAYLSKAMVLASSLHQHQKVSLNIIIFDSRREIYNIPNFVNIFWIDEFNINNLSQLAFKYDITEFSTSLKPWLALHFLEHSNEVIFLDPDIFICSSLDSVFLELHQDSVLLTPHFMTPKDLKLDDSNLGLMRFGSFNLGFFAVSKGQESLAFLRWWSDQCVELCFFEPAFGISTDQKWVSIAPCFFPCIKISYNMGFNVAMWNLHERNVGVDKIGRLMVNEKSPLVFMHFSSFDQETPSNISRRPFYAASNLTPTLISLSKQYADAIYSLPLMVNDLSYGFDFMSNGDYISPTLRRAYSSVLSELPLEHDPFNSVGVVGSFAKKNHLISKKRGTYSPLGYSDVQKYSLQLAFANFLLRLLLRVLGPNQSFNLSRLLVFLSSYRLNRGLWKL